jgi:hypothetical protein
MERLETVSQLLTSLDVTTLSNSHHSIQKYDDHGFFVNRLPHSIIQEIRESGFVARLSGTMQSEASAILNDKPLEQLTSEELQRSERLAIATSGKKAFSDVFKNPRDAAIVLAIRSHIKETIVKLQLLTGIDVTSTSSTSTGKHSASRMIGNQKRKITLMESLLYSVAGSTKVKLLHRDMQPEWNDMMVLCFVGLQDGTSVSLIPRSHHPDYDTRNSLGARVYTYGLGDVVFFKPGTLHSGYKYPDNGNLRIHYYGLLTKTLPRWKGEKAHFAEMLDIQAVEHYHFGGNEQKMSDSIANARIARVDKKRKRSESAAEARAHKALHRSIAISCDEAMKKATKVSRDSDSDVA